MSDARNREPEVIASQYILVDFLREQGVQLAEPIGLDRRLDLEVLRVRRSDGAITFDYGVSAIGIDGVRVNVLADLQGDEQAQNANRVSSLFAITEAAFGRRSSRERKLNDIDPEQFAFALIEARQQMLIRLSSDFYPYAQLCGIADEDSRKTRLFSDAVVLGQYARSGVLSAGTDEDDLFRQLCYITSGFIGRGPLERVHVVAPLDPSTGKIHSEGDAALLVDLVLIGALIRLQLSEHQYQHDTELLFGVNSHVTLAELGILTGLSPDDIMRQPATGLGAIHALVTRGNKRADLISIPRDIAREWLRAQGTAGF